MGGGFFSIPAAGIAQILAFCALVELAWWPANNYSGDYGCGFFGTSYNDDPETKATKLNAELANGRLAILGIAGPCSPRARPARRSLSSSRTSPPRSCREGRS